MLEFAKAAAFTAPYLEKMFKFGKESAHRSQIHKLLLENATKMWHCKELLELNLLVYCELEQKVWLAEFKSLGASIGNPRKLFYQAGPFKTGRPTGRLNVSFISRHQKKNFPSEHDLTDLAQFIESLQKENAELAAAVAQWSSFENFCCNLLASKQYGIGKSMSAYAIKRRMRKKGRAIAACRLDSPLLNEKRALWLARLPERIFR